MKRKKLINITFFSAARWMVPVFLIGIIFIFFTIRYIAYEEIDEFLTFEMERLMSYHEENGDLPEYHQVAYMLQDVSFEKPLFKDTLILEPGDNEMVPYRELFFTINHNNRDFTIVLRHLLLGKDDIFQGTMIIMVGLMLLITLLVLFALNSIASKIWQPFYETLSLLKRHKIEEPVPLFPVTNIEEFDTLNVTAGKLLKKLGDDFSHNKAFNENASHELQTHLAVIRANTEKLINTLPADVAGSNELNLIYSSATKLSRIQKSLLLLSKISNREFSNNIKLNLKLIVASALETFEEAIQLRGINLIAQLSDCHLTMDPGLAEILANNLLKNAIKHNQEEGYLSITLSEDSLIVKNPGSNHEGNTEILLQRFQKGKGGNRGIGLAIVKEICEIYDFNLTYQVENRNIHIISINFKRE